MRLLTLALVLSLSSGVFSWGAVAGDDSHLRASKANSLAIQVAESAIRALPGFEDYRQETFDEEAQRIFIDSKDDGLETELSKFLDAKFKDLDSDLRLVVFQALHAVYPKGSFLAKAVDKKLKQSPLYLEQAEAATRKNVDTQLLWKRIEAEQRESQLAAAATRVKEEEANVESCQKNYDASFNLALSYEANNSYVSLYGSKVRNPETLKLYLERANRARIEHSAAKIRLNAARREYERLKSNWP